MAELKAIGIDFPSTEAEQLGGSEPSIVEYQRSNQFSVGRNATYDRLVAKRMFREGERMIEESHWEEGLEKMEEARRVSPQDPWILNDLAWNLLVAPMKHRDPKQALQYASEAVQSDDSRNNFNTLGTAQYRCGRWNDAITSLTKSLGDGTNPTAAIDYYLLACCQVKLGQVEAARKSLAKGVESQQLHSAEVSSAGTRERKLFRTEAENLLKEIGLPESLPPKGLQ